MRIWREAEAGACARDVISANRGHMVVFVALKVAPNVSEECTRVAKPVGREGAAGVYRGGHGAEAMPCDAPCSLWSTMSLQCWCARACVLH